MITPNWKEAKCPPKQNSAHSYRGMLCVSSQWWKWVSECEWAAAAPWGAEGATGEPRGGILQFKFTRKQSVSHSVVSHSLCSPPGSCVCGILKVRMLEWVAIPFFRVTSQARDQTQVSCIVGEFFTIWATRGTFLTCGQEAIIRTGHETTDWFKIGKAVCQGCISSPCLFNLYTQYIMHIMQNASQSGWITSL